MENVHHWALRLRSQREHGVTLIELMVGIAVFAVLLAIAAPNFQSMTASSRLTSSSNELLGSLQQARALAIRTGTRVTVCKSTTGTQCNTTNSVGWHNGWLVFQDTTRSGANASVDTGETISTRIPALHPGATIAGSTSVINYVSFAADGRPRMMDGTVQSGTLRLCDPGNSLANNSRARDIVLTPTGQVTITRPTGIANTCPSP